MRLFPTGRDQRGGVAIEYAVIAALLALGIVGSLISTKTSLNAVFNGVSGNMSSASSSGSGGDSLASQVASYWAAKGLTKKTFDAPNSRNIYSYADGSAVYVTIQNGVQVPAIVYVDKAKNTTGNVSINSSDVPTYFSVNQYAKDNTTILYSNYTKQADFANGVTQTESVDNYSNGNFVNTTRQAPTAQYNDAVANGLATARYFAAQ